MVTKVALYTLENESCSPRLVDWLLQRRYKQGLMVTVGVHRSIEWPFQFWDSNQKCHIKTKLERLNHIEDRIYIVYCN